MYSRFTTTKYARRGVIAAKRIARRDGEREWARTAGPSNSGTRHFAHTQRTETDYDDELCYVAVLGEN
jgi:hypothetical protein